LVIAGPMSAVEVGMIPLGLAMLVAAWKLPRLYLLAFRQPTSMAVLAWVLWQALSGLWTSDHDGLWLKQFGMARWSALLIAIYPLLERRRTLIAAAAISFVAMNASQLITGLALKYGWSMQLSHDAMLPWTVVREFPDRNAGWSVPVAGATVLVGGLGMHLPAAIMGRGRERVLACAGSVATLIGIIETGTRAAWIGAVALIAIVCLVAIMRRRGAAAKVHAMLISLVLLGGACGVGWMVAGDAISQRATAAWTEVRAAVRDGNFESDNGARLLMARMGWEAFKERPIVGIGVGGFRSWMQPRLAAHGVEHPERFSQHGHCHNTVLQVAATTGLVGLAIFTLMIWAGLHGAFSNLGTHGLGSYSAGPAFALVGLLTVIPFDVIHVNAQSAALMYLLLALSAVKRPREIGCSEWKARRR
jgi:O-antigen ligase